MTKKGAAKKGEEKKEEKKATNVGLAVGAQIGELGRKEADQDCLEAMAPRDPFGTLPSETADQKEERENEEFKEQMKEYEHPEEPAYWMLFVVIFAIIFCFGAIYFGDEIEGFVASLKTHSEL